MTYSPPRPVTPRRPGLSPRQIRGVLIAGGVGAGLITVGATVLSGILAWGFFITQSLDEFDPALTLDVSELLGVPTPFLAGAATVAVIVIALGILMSRWILRFHGFHKPGVVIAIGLAVSAVPSLIVLILFFLMIGLAWSVPLPVVSVLYLVMQITIGALSWWWIAHALRPQPEPITTLGMSSPENAHTTL